jgi:hypothetical protein
MPHFACSLMVQNLFFIMTGIASEMTGYQHDCCSIQQIRSEMQAKKLITYHFFRLLSFETHGIASVARLQRKEMSTTQQKARGTSTFSTGIYGGHASSVNFGDDFESADHTANALTDLLEVLHLSKHTANAQQI